MPNDVDAAVALLVKAVDYTRTVTELTRTVEHARKLASRYPACFSALVDLGMKDRDKFEALIRQVEQERLVNPDVRRGDYQRLLMRKRRARFAKMKAIAKLQNPSITPSQLKTLLKQQNKLMNQERDAYIAHQKLGDEDVFVYSEAVHAFWAATDKELDAQLLKLRKVKA